MSDHSVSPTASLSSRLLQTLRHRTTILVALGLLAVTIGACQYARRDAQPVAATTTVTRGDLEKTVTAVGSLKARDYVDVGTQVSGRVEKIHFDIGDRVKKGDLIAELDPQIYASTVRKDEANLENLQAQLSQKNAELVLARQQLARNRGMRASNAVSQQTVDEAEATAAVAEATITSIQAQIKAAQATLAGNKVNLSYTKIYSPLDGSVVSQTTLEGQTVNAVQSAPIIVQVANLDVMTVWAQVAEADVTKINTGMSAYFTTLGMAERRWRGTVRQVQPTPTVENDVVLYNVLIDVDNRENLLLPSMTVQVFFVLEEAKNATLIDLQALQPVRKETGDYQATVVGRNGPELRKVKVGLTNRRSAVVLSGLVPGDKVALPQKQMAGMPRFEGGPPMGMGGGAPPPP